MPSIERRLLAWVLGVLAAAAIVLVTISYLITLRELNEGLDDNLKELALAIANYHHEDGRGIVRHVPSNQPERQSLIDVGLVTAVWSKQGELRFASSDKAALPPALKTGWLQVNYAGHRWHRYTLVLDDGIVVVGQRAETRREIAAESAVQMLLPIVVLMLVLAVLLVIALRRGLLPLDRAARDVAQRSATSLAAIDETRLPSEIHPLVRAINDLMQRLAGAFSVQQRFVADAAHELRTPVTALKLQLSLLEQSHSAPERAAAAAELRAGIERAQRLIEQLLHLSRADPSVPAAEAGPVDLGALAQQVVASYSHMATSRGIDLGAEVPADVTVSGDAPQLRILLNNLVENALRYAPRGGTVDVRVGREGAAAVLTVLDDGPGIAPAERERVFDRFYRGVDTQQNPAATVGSGLGLAIVQAIAQQHGAMASLHTPASGAGLAVRVVFPAVWRAVSAGARPPVAAATTGRRS